MKQEQRVYSCTISLLSDQHSPVGVYARIRLHYPETFLLESNEPYGTQSAKSIIGIKPIARFQAIQGEVKSTIKLNQTAAVSEQFKEFFNSLKFESDESQTLNGIFGYTAFDAVKYFESISFKEKPSHTSSRIPEMQYALYKYILVFDHYNHTLHISHNSFDKASLGEFYPITSILKEPLPEPYSFTLEESEKASLTDSEFLSTVNHLKEHIHKGDIFQIVPSRRFTQKFRGDEFQVYRALRSINPSPYLFYYDSGTFRLFGSSPETALIVKNGKAILNPIAGSTKRLEDADANFQAIESLKSNPKEQSEHIMLVDLARNDLSKSAFPVTVDEYMTVRSYSHVTHLVSAVSGTITDKKSTLDIFFETFPAGTVSGAPKYRAMQLIDTVEPEARGFYAGAIGFFGSQGSCVHALTIRSFLSKDSTLTYQAGAGIVADSDPRLELQEINHKLGALRAALIKGEKLHG
jgi:anthranilate synthase component 1